MRRQLILAGITLALCAGILAAAEICGKCSNTGLYKIRCDCQKGRISLLISMDGNKFTRESVECPVCNGTSFIPSKSSCPCKHPPGSKLALLYEARATALRIEGRAERALFLARHDLRVINRLLKQQGAGTLKDRPALFVEGPRTDKKRGRR